MEQTIERQLTQEEKETLHRMVPDDDPRTFRMSDYQTYLALGQLEVSNPAYFEEIVSKSIASASLPHIIGHGNIDNDSEDISLYATNTKGEVVLPEHTDSYEGMALALGVLPRMLSRHVSSCLQHELRLMMASRSTSEEQMSRIRSFLDQFCE